MRIGIDATVLHGEKSGVATYTEELTLALARLFPDDAFVLFSNRAVEFKAEITANVQVERSLLVPTRALWMQLALPALARTGRLDVFHFTNSLAPRSISMPFLLSIHDMSIRLLPGSHTWKKRIVWRLLLPNAVENCKAVVTGSESAAADIRAAFPSAAKKVLVIPYAASTDFQPAAPGEDFGLTLEALGVKLPYILAAGNLEPRKDFATLAKAFQLLRRDGRIPHRLYLCGPSGWKNRELKKLLRSHKDGKIVYLGYVSRRELRALYCSADLFAYPSTMEGFGLPLLEAMSCGTPVVAATNSAIEEVAGSAARFFATHSVAELQEALMELLEDPARREKWRRLGLARASQFSWENTARQTMEVYRRIAAPRG